MLGDAMFYGRGAGKQPTASAVTADVIDAVRNKGAKFNPPWKAATASVLVPYEDMESAMYVRLSEYNEAALTDSIGAIFGNDVQTAVSDSCFAFIAPKDKIGTIMSKVASLPAKLEGSLMVLD